MIARIRCRVRSVPNDRGMTLVELLVYMILLGIVVGIIASVLINSLQKQREVVQITQSNNTGQTVTSRVDLAVKNAVYFRTVESGGSVLLVTKTRSTTDGMDQADVARCVAFYYDATTLKLHSATEMLPPGSSLSPLTGNITDASGLSVAQTWPVLAEGIQRVPAGGGGTSPVFAKGSDASKVEITFMIDTLDDKEPVTFQLTSGMRGSGAIDNEGTC